MYNAVMENRKDTLLWLIVGALVASFGVSFFMLHSIDMKLKLAALCFSVPLALFCISKTTQGTEFLKFWNGAVYELKKVVWPTKKETTSSLIAVGVMVTVMCILIAIIDSIYGKLFSFLLA